MPPSPDDKIIEDAVQDFSKGLHSDLPLRHFAEFHDQKELNKVVDLHKENILGNVIAKVWPRDKDEIFSLLTNVNDRINKEATAEWRNKNWEHRVKSVSFLQKWVDMLCENFNMALEYQLQINPDIDLESLISCVQRRKQIATNVFESIWKPGNPQIQEERRSKLEKQLQILEDEVFEKHQRILESKSVDEGRKLLGEVRTIVLERSRQLKSYASKQQGQASTATLREMVEEISEYLVKGKGSVLRESHGEIYNNVMKITEGEIKFLTEEPDEKLTAKEVAEFADRFDEKLRSCFLDNAPDKAKEMPQDRNKRNIIEGPRQWVSMQGILNEFKKEHGNSMDLEEKGLDCSTHEESVERSNDGNNVDGEEPGPEITASGKKTRQRPSRRVKRSVRDTDSYGNDPTMVSSNNADASEVTPSKKLRSGRDGAITTRSDSGIHRRSSRLNKAAQSNSISAPKRDSLRAKKFSHDLDVIKKRRSCENETPRPNCEFRDITHEDSVINTNTIEPPLSPPHSLRMNKTSPGNEDSLEDSQQKLKSSKYAASETTVTVSGRNGNPRAFSEGSQLSSICTKSKEWKSGRASKCCSNDEKVCPPSITILKGDIPVYFCDVCKKTFKQRRTLKCHGEFCGTVKPPKSCICDECGKGFYGPAELDRHTRVHTGEKPFQCPKCPERFTQKGHLLGHIRCHDKEKSFTCKPCNLTFMSTHRLHEHNLTHGRKLPFSCSYCEKRFHSMSRLRYHVIIHADERPFECTQCTVFFSQFEYLLTHLERTHGQPKELAQKLAHDACVAYLQKETKNESCHDIPFRRHSSVVVKHVIKKANLQLPPNA